MKRSHWFRGTVIVGASILAPFAGAHMLLPWYLARGTTDAERRSRLPGDALIADPQTEYTLGATVRATPSTIWPWLLQIGQGRGGFYTYEWIENLLGAQIQNAERIIPIFQRLTVGDQVRLTPDPYLGQPGQFMTVVEVQSECALVFKQTLPNGEPATWAILLQPRNDGTTRVLMRRRSGRPTVFDRVMRPGYVFMDRGMLRGIRRRAEIGARA